VYGDPFGCYAKADQRLFGQGGLALRPEHPEQNNRYGLFDGFGDRTRFDFATDKEALRFKKSQGMILGRPPGPGKSKLDPYRPEIEGLLANGSTQKFVASRYHTTEANLHNWLKKRGLK
jgi:hypothetical protein